MYIKQSRKRELIKRGLCLISFLIISEIYMLVNRYTGRERELTTFIDNLIPFNKYFIFAYIFWYVYVLGFLIYFCIYDEKRFYKLLTSINIGMIIAYIIYILFPTTVPRPVFNTGNDLIGKIFEFIYTRDNPYNCFPSIHVMNTFIIAIYVQRDNLYLNKFVKAMSLICAGLITYSTFAIKQHVVLDAVAAAFIAYGLYSIFNYKEMFAKFRSLQRLLET